MARVDYEESAGAFRRARTLPPAVLEVWRAAVTVDERGDRRRVVDVGAGTGQFLEPLGEWFAAPVVAVEPSPAMRVEALAQGLGARFCWSAATAEGLPFADNAFDVAWLSTVVHQFVDRTAAVRELRRVVQPGGRALVRGFFADQSVSGLFARFPGIDRAAATFPSTTDVVDLFESHDFGVRASVDVVEPWTFEVASWVDRVRSIRHTDSALRPLTDAEFERGIATVQAEFEGTHGEVASDATLRLLVFDA